MDFDTAEQKAKDYLQSLSLGDESDKLVIVRIDTRTYGWIFFYESKKYIETGNILDCLLGSATFLITKEGQLYDYYIDPYKSFKESIQEFELKHNLKHEPDKFLGSE
jgi:hypothetical protein